MLANLCEEGHAHTQPLLKEKHARQAAPEKEQSRCIIQLHVTQSIVQTQYPEIVPNCIFI